MEGSGEDHWRDVAEYGEYKNNIIDLIWYV